MMEMRMGVRSIRLFTAWQLGRAPMRANLSTAFTSEDRGMSKPKFEFKELKESRLTYARVGLLSTAHGSVRTPAFVMSHPTELLVGNTEKNRAEWSKFPLLYSSSTPIGAEAADKRASQQPDIYKFLSRDGPIFTPGCAVKAATAMLRENDRAMDKSGSFFVEQVQQQPKVDFDVTAALDYGNISTLEDQRLKNWALREALIFQTQSVESKPAAADGRGRYGHIYVDSVEPRARKTRDAAQQLGALPFDGFYLTTGDVGDSELDLMDEIVHNLPRSCPKHLRNARSLRQIERAIDCGVDTFDSDLPDALGQSYKLLTRHGILPVEHASNKYAFFPPDDDFGERDFTLAYLHHLVQAHEPLAGMLCVLHNVKFLADFINNKAARLANSGANL